MASKRLLEILHILKATIFSLSFDDYHFNDCIGAHVISFIGLSSIDIDEFNFSIFGSQKNKIWIKNWSEYGCNHGVVLNLSLEEHGLYLSVSSSHDLINADCVV